MAGHVGVTPKARGQAPEGGSYQAVVEYALQEFRAGNWQESRVMFLKAHELRPSARTWRALGMTSFELRHYVEAVDELQRALDYETDPLAGHLRDQVETLLSRAQSFVGVCHLSVEPAAAQVTVDGEPWTGSGTDTVRLNPGTHTVAVSAPGRRSETRTVVIDAGTERQLRVHLASLEADASPSQEGKAVRASSPPSTERRRLPPARRAAWALSAVTLALAGAAVGLGVSTSKTHLRLGECTESCESLQDKGPTLQLLTNTTAGLAMATAVAAIVTFSLPVPVQDSHATVLVGPGSIGYRQAF